jgi:hypothetical protein
MHPTDKPELIKDFKGAVNSYQTDVRMVFMYLLIYLSGGKVIVAAGDDIKHRSPLWSEFITMLTQYIGYPLRSRLHFN